MRSRGPSPLGLLGLAALLATGTAEAGSECRASRLLPWEWTSDDGGVRRFRQEQDVDGDGRSDTLEGEESSGSGFGLTSVRLVLGSGERFKADFQYSFSSICQTVAVPPALLEARHQGARELMEEALFGRVCTQPDPSLAWLLEPRKHLRWIAGPSVLPDTYVLRRPGGDDVICEADGKPGRSGPHWLWYGGHNHAYRGGEGPREPVVLAQAGPRVLLGTPHGVILTDPRRSRHAWVYVSRGQHKLRWPSVLKARIEGPIAVITLSRGDGYLVESGTREVRVNLETGAPLLTTR